MELRLQFFAPLFGEGGWREHEDRTHEAALDQLLHDDAGFDSLAQADLIGKQCAPAHLVQSLEGGVDLVLVVFDVQLFQRDEPIKAPAQTQRLALGAEGDRRRPVQVGESGRGCGRNSQGFASSR